MKILIRKSYVDVVGRIWLPPAVCSLRIPMTDYDIENVRDNDGKLTRESVEQWLVTHSGDFQSIIDFSASIEDGEQTVNIPFATEDGELAYCDTLSCEE